MDKETFLNIGNYGLLACITVCAVAWSPFSYNHVTAIRFFVWSLFTIGLFVLVASREDFGVFRSPAIWLLGGYTLIVFASGLFAINKAEWLYEFLKTFVMLVFLFVVATLDDKYTYPKLAIPALFLSVFGIIRICFGHINGTGGHQNSWAELLVLLIPFCWEHKTVVVLLLVNIFFTKCRAACLASGVVLFILCGKKEKYLIVCFMIISAIYFFNTKGLSSHERIGAWRATCAMIKDFPFGVGAGNWRIMMPQYGKYFTESSIMQTYFYNKPHNDYLWILSETGIFGFAFFIGFLGYLFYKAKDKVLLAGIAAFSILMFFSFPMEHSIHLILFLTFAGLILKNDYEVLRFRLWPVVLFVLCFSSVDFWFRYQASCQANEVRTVKPIPDIPISWLCNVDETTQSLYLFRGLGRYSQKNFNGALRDFQAACNATPYSPLAFAITGSFLIDVNMPDKAKLYIDRSLEICPTFELALKYKKLLNY